ncbi:sensor histidine kinase [Solimicrobium silvestre]|uniref:Histidine kinase n=1 Tax=Solimicrobium silvestre TaxID=2099400 RepID=A0A2S9H1H2_9BURK|nr:sensor histidine kinase [Solimicrobium silvestre]PRC93834.1 Histidine kinase [Solimicrobium silvestre]
MKLTSLNVPGYPGTHPQTAANSGGTSSGSTALRYGLCQLLGWGLIVLFNLSYSFFMPSSEWLGLTLIAVWGGCAGLALSHSWRRHLRQHHLLEQALLSRNALHIVIGIVVIGSIQLLLVYGAFLLVQPVGMSKGWAWIPSSLLFWIFTFVAWTVFYATVLSRRRIRHTELEKLQLEIYLKENELRALQAQINPHFFFNSLNSIRALIYHDADAAAEMIDQLSNMMRYTLQVGQTTTVTLAQEWAAVRSYLSIEKIRFAERIKVTEQMDSAFDQLEIPPMVLQILVENAVKYGVEQRSSECQIELRVQRQDKHLQIQVANQGRLATIITTNNSTRLGINNIAKRLQLLYGEQASIGIEERDGWVIATLLLPLPSTP